MTFPPTYRDYPKAYLDTLDAFKILDDETLRLRTVQYADVVYRYLWLYRLKFSTRDSSEENLFQKMYALIDIAERNNRHMQENLLSCCLLYNLKKRYISFPTFLNEFDSTFPGSPPAFYLDSMYALRKAIPAPTIGQAMNNILVTPDGQQIAFHKVLGGKPVLVDCWASWCKPCIAQFPSSKDIEAEYGSKVDFIYLSLDKDKVAWLAKNSQLGLTQNTYLLLKNFTSDFAYYYDIDSIPRYLLFDRNGKLINSSSPRPSRKDALRKALDNALADAK
jgi:thiol-disulfide isomerase/thioredoxin